ncbi:SemiSWEET family sugar transporter [Flavobacterium sp. 3HN19-14]|uniref:SemiSWEET family sugar transporter n=1 Tax=Flavobacterium sp. 3HN19-14 TaxID=3448133 RepID=UPI003EE07538
MDYIKIIGLAAAVFTTIANVPQTYKIIKDKTTKGVSPTTYFILLIGLGLWIAYGIIREDFPVILANGISALIAITILILYYNSDKVIEDIHEKVLPEKIKEEAKAEESEAEN